MVIFPGSKINIGLNIIEKRDEGYHALESVFYPLSLSDVLEIVKSDAFSFDLSGIEVDGDPENNLVAKAYHLIHEKFDIGPVKIHLHKNVPLGAGLGGGSADGSATLVLLNQLFELEMEEGELCKLSEQLGSDCPFFIAKEPTYVKGRGELLEPADFDLTGYYIQVVNPGIHISTAAAFENISLSHDEYKLHNHLKNDPNEWKGHVLNDFETTIFPKFPEIKALKDKLYENGAVYASMTGTGSSVYGIFKTEPSVAFKNYFEWIGKL